MDSNQNGQPQLFRFLFFLERGAQEATRRFDARRIEESGPYPVTLTHPERPGELPWYPDGLWWAHSATTLSTLAACQQAWKWQVDEGRKLPSRALEFGKAAHTGWEWLDRAQLWGDKSQGFGLDLALVKADSATKDWSTVPDNLRTRDMLGRMLTAYADEHWGGAVRPLADAEGVPYLERSFEIPAGTYPDGRAWWLVGHLDSRVEFGGWEYIRERKATGSSPQQYWKLYTPRPQIALYDWAGDRLWGAHAGVMVEVALLQWLKTRGGNVTFERRLFPRTPAHRAEFLQNATRLITSYYFNHSAGSFPLNETACGNYGGCPFRGACDQPPGPQRAFVLDKATPKGVVWSPLEQRG